MNTKFDVGETVYLKVCVKKISIEKDLVKYNIRYQNDAGNYYTEWVKEEDLKK